MSIKPKYLIDTNILIGLEDHREIPPLLATFTSLAGKHDVRLFVHEATSDDIDCDKNPSRRTITLSKTAKFQILKKVLRLSQEDLEQQFGPIKNRNDVVDATLLHALSIGAADFLVTEDRKLHARARRHATHLDRRVLYIADAVDKLRTTYEDIAVPIRFVQELFAYEIPEKDEIFDSLREGYPEFDPWWREKCVEEHRKCWVVSDDNEIAGLAVRKDESEKSTGGKAKPKKILKICTFKVRPKNRGVKLGELLLRQIFWFAQANRYDLVYLTTYPSQQALIDLLEYYGFKKTNENEKGELTYEKHFTNPGASLSGGDSDFDLARLNYPRFSVTDAVPVYVVPIKEPFHDQLFPDLKTTLQPDMFEEVGLSGGPKRPGNTIRKVYLSRASAKITVAGSILFFYKGKSKSPPSQAITVVGIFEDMKLAKSTDELVLLTGGRSVYSEGELRNWAATARKPVKVINFLLAGYITPPVELVRLQANGIFKEHPGQSIFSLRDRRRKKMLQHLKGRVWV